ncbi:hypothetical protein ANN_25228 [Periplaneta americana]|uniref:Uncharacterized protein n=1 Tax=Periplaneta americana TaxID=6978 RepID=A0ABQ8S145_PERAM|nr:hypothetical protein ANN_25228 [Periplaneta americana]
MSPGSSTESYPAFARIGLRGKPREKPQPDNLPDRDSNPGHLVSQPDALTVTPQWKFLDLAKGGICIYVLDSSKSLLGYTRCILVNQPALKKLKVRIYKTVILLVLLYGCETWTLTLREEEEERQRVFENKVLKKIFGAKKDEDEKMEKVTQHRIARIVFFT